jgi:hypothetical protein
VSNSRFYTGQATTVGREVGLRHLRRRLARERHGLVAAGQALLGVHARQPERLLLAVEIHLHHVAVDHLDNL